jgi:protein tyrosine/serine phosphatase
MGRLRAWFYAMFVEHNLVNLFRRNFHKLSDDAFRSAQPTMSQLEKTVKKHGIRTIINLKDNRPDSPYYIFEAEKCRELGVRLVDVNIASRSFPSQAKLRQAKELFEQVEHPVWMHCKAGADRSSIYATLYQHFKLGIPLDQTDQLKLWPYGHIKHSGAGKFDFFLEKYLEYQKTHPETGFLEWAETVVDYAQLNQAFKPGGLAAFINDHVLGRE